MFGAAELSDDVVRAAAAGSRVDLARVSEVLQPQVRLMVIGRLAPTPAQFDAVDETTQEVVLALTTGITRLEHRTVDGLRAFLSGIVTRQVAQLLKRRQKGNGGGRPVRSLDSTVCDASGALPRGHLLSASGMSPGSVAARDEEIERLMSELGRLTPRYRDVLILAFFDQLSPCQIAAELGISPKAAAMLLKRALRALRQKIGGRARSG